MATAWAELALAVGSSKDSALLRRRLADLWWWRCACRCQWFPAWL